MRSELDALCRHLRKGRNISTWEPRYLSGLVMAVISEDLGKGLDPGEVIGSALTVALPGDAYEWAEKAAPAPGQSQNQQAQQIAQKYSAQIQTAFGQVAAQAAALVASWMSGALAVTAAGLAAMITALLAKLLGPLLRLLWAEAWALGVRLAAKVTGMNAPADDGALAAWMDSHGLDWLQQISRTNEDEVADGLDESARDGEDTKSIIAKLPGWLDALKRSLLIAVDQVQRAMNAAMMWLARKLGIVEKKNVTRDDAKVCGTCKANAAAGWISLSRPYPSGQLEGPFYPRCRCRQSLRVQLSPFARKFAGGRRYVDLPGQEWWTPADSSPHGPAMGGGGPVHAAHDADDIQQYIPGGVPGMTAGGEPPRWDGGEAPHIVAVSPRTDSAGRGNTRTRGGGTAGGPYRDFSHGTHASSPEDADDAAWPGERGTGPVTGPRWPQQGYMGGYWPEGGHGTAQAPGMSVGAADRGRPPNAHGKASVPGLTPRSGMISLDLPEGTITPVPGGVDDHHVTVAYLGADVDDETFARACLRACAAAALLPGPLAGVISGIGSFPPSGSGSGKVPAWAGVMLPGAEGAPRGTGRPVSQRAPCLAPACDPRIPGSG